MGDTKNFYEEESDDESVQSSKTGKRKKPANKPIDLGYGLISETTLTPCTYPWVLQRFETAFGEGVGIGAALKNGPHCKYTLIKC